MSGEDDDTIALAALMETIAGLPSVPKETLRGDAVMTLLAPADAKAASVSYLPRLSIAPRATALGAAIDLQVTGVLGEGGMGRVLLGFQRSLKRDVALKTLGDDTSSERREALLSEGFVTGHLEHPNIVPVHQLGLDDDGKPLLVMKRVIGVSLDELLEDADHAWWRLPQTNTSSRADRLVFCLRTLMAIADAVAFAHSRGVIHRDIKPANVMIGEFGQAYLVDWGLASFVDDVKVPGGVYGTPAFMAPEMLRGEPLGTFTDVYLLGATLHAVLTDNAPRHAGSDLRAVIEAAFKSKPFDYAADVPRELATLANEATARDPAARPPSALAIRDRIATYLSHSGADAITAAAEARLREMEATAEPDAIRRLGSEARFGFLTALGAWPASPSARAGLSRCLEAMAKNELAQRQVGAARALVDALASSLGHREHPIFAELERAEASAAAEADEVKQLRCLVADRDLSSSVFQRRRFTFGILVAVVAVTMLSFDPATKSFEPSAAVSFGSALFTLVGSLVGLYVGRKQLLQNTANRAFLGVFVGTLLLVTLNRALTLVVGGRSVPVTLQTDMFVVSASCFVTAIQGSGRIWVYAAAAMLVGALAAGVWPGSAAIVFPGGVSVLLALGALGWLTPHTTLER